MKILTNKRYKELLAAEFMSDALKNNNSQHLEKITEILDRMVEKEGRENCSAYVTRSDVNFSISRAGLDENQLKIKGYARLLDTYEGGKVFEHEAVDLIHIDKGGNVTKHKTKEADKGYSYKLIRE